MKPFRAKELGIAVTFGALLLGCASIVGIGDLDGGTGSSSGTSSSGSSSGAGSSSGSSSSGSSGSSGGGGIALGKACPSGSGCQAGLVCYAGTCRETCTTVGNACTNNVGICESFAAGLACTVPCDPFPDSCSTGLACEVGELTGTTTVLSDCEPPGTIGPRQACSNYNDCTAGFTCPIPSGVDTCQPWCTSSCAGGSTCEPYVTFNNTSYGFCSP